MNKSIIKNILLLILFLGLGITSCSDRDDEITELDLERLFTPSSLESTLNKEVNLVLKWRNVNGAESYIVELYNDSLAFNEDNFVDKVEVTSNKFEYTLDGDMRYSVRVKSLVSNGKESKWSTGLTFKTGLNNIFLGQQSGDITDSKATLRWPAGVNATKITLSPTGGGDAISQDVTASEVATGVVTIEGLNPQTEYSVILYDGQAKIGSTTIVTMSDGAIMVSPEDDFLSILASAEEGAIFLLKPGEYLKSGEMVTITKSISIKGETESNKPIIHAQLQLERVSSFTLSNVILDGTKEDATLLDYALRFTAPSGTYGNISISGCEIKNFNKSLVAAESAMKAVVETLEFDNCIITNIQGNGGDGIDVRAGLIKNLKLTRSTLNNVTNSRDFIRLDDTATSFPSQTSNVSIDKCTFYNVCNGNLKRIVYVRFTTNVISVTNSIFAQTVGIYSNQSKTANIDCSKNNYFSAPNFLAESAISGGKFDTSGSHTTLDPSFEAPESGNFKVKNANVTVGDPRWLE